MRYHVERFFPFLGKGVLNSPLLDNGLVHLGLGESLESMKLMEGLIEWKLFMCSCMIL